MLSAMARPLAEATLIMTEPASMPMSPVSASPLAKMMPPRATLRGCMYEARRSIAGGGSARNSEWLRRSASFEHLSRGWLLGGMFSIVTISGSNSLVAD
jgi:hypothetical protein